MQLLFQMIKIQSSFLDLMKCNRILYIMCIIYIKYSEKSGYLDLNKQILKSLG